jgi:hypothetical protein
MSGTARNTVPQVFFEAEKDSQSSWVFLIPQI